MEQVFVRRPNKEQIELLSKQPIWEHENATWDAEYDERVETALIITGKAYVTTYDGIKHYFQAGDLVTFSPNMKCVWTVTEPISKHYIFDAKI